MANRELIAPVRDEIVRQCEIGAGSIHIDGETGLWQVNADLDPNGLLAALESRPAPTEERDSGLIDPDWAADWQGDTPSNRPKAPTMTEREWQFRGLLDAIQGEQKETPDCTIVAFIHPNGDWSVYNGRASREILDAQLPPKPTTPERAKAMEEIDREMLRSAIGRGLDDGPFNLHSDRITAIEERVIAALSASPPEVVEQRP